MYKNFKIGNTYNIRLKKGFEIMENRKLGTDECLKGYVNLHFVDYIENTPEQIGAFIMENWIKGDIMICDWMDLAVVTTMGMFIDRCSDKEYLLKYFQPTMIALQTGEKEVEFTPYELNNTEDDEYDI